MHGHVEIQVVSCKDGSTKQSGPAMTAHGLLDLKQEIQIQNKQSALISIDPFLSSVHGPVEVEVTSEGVTSRC
jgi:hypothetical protein